MKVIAWDTETFLIQPGLAVPEMVCLSSAERVNGQIDTGLHDAYVGSELACQWIEDDDVKLVGHNLPYDLAVVVRQRPDILPAVFRKFERGLFCDTMTQQQLLDIATGENKFYQDEDGEPKRTAYSLAALSYRIMKKWLKKEDTWRLRYGELKNVPIADWPDDARKYAIDDSITTLELFEAQEKIAGIPDEVSEVPDLARQMRAQWALHLMSVWGVRTDGDAVRSLKEDLTRDLAAHMEVLRKTDLIKQVKKKGEIHDQRDMKAIRARVERAFVAQGIAVPMTEPSKKFPEGQIATDKNAMNDSGDPDLKRLTEAGAIEKLLSTYIPALEGGTRVPVNAFFNVLVESGRTSCRGPNWQNPPRKGGVRECVVPRKGFVFISADYPTLEMRTLAQVQLDLLGESRMAEVLRTGKDLHIVLAAQLLGISVEEAEARAKKGDVEVEEQRQLAKIGNFGMPGGLSAKTFVAYAAGFGFEIPLEKAEEVHAAFFGAWPEMRAYFRHIEDLADAGVMVQARSGRVRGGISYCAAANSYFQGLAADGAKEAVWNVAKECYTVPESPLFGTRPIIFLHDEIFAETPWDPAQPEKASAAAFRLAKVMEDSMSKWIPDIPISVEPVMTRRWYKGAKPVEKDKILVPCKPFHSVGADGKKKLTWVADL